MGVYIIAEAGVNHTGDPELARRLLDAAAEAALVPGTETTCRIHFVDFGGRRWEVDVFEAENAGLVLAEIEIESADADVALPPWVGAEVSSDPRYYNTSLSAHPFREWGTGG